MPEGNSLLIPEVSSERRQYIPIGFIGPEVLCSNKVRLIPNATRYHFGVLHSRIHNAWMRVVGVRLKSDYSYSAAIVYNNFVWPAVDPSQEAEITALVQEVLNARSQHPEATMANFYDPTTAFLYPNLLAAHKALDDAVERAYGLEPGLDEADVVTHLFELYGAAVGATS